jgi:uncharacterized protein (DUF1697 family)
MTRHVALLRGVNVGGHKGVAMAELRAVAAALSLGEPRTLSQSGNLVFDSGNASTAELEARLESECERRLGLSTEIHVRSTAQWAHVLAANPFPDEAVHDPARLVLMAFKAPPSPAGLQALQASCRGPERLGLNGREAYVFYPEGIGASRLTPALLDRHLGRGTGRNWNTVTKLAALLAD